jgi:oxygen-independent coproporphyrinogen-3 oxidase
MQPAGIYISIPFCRQKCTYCNFASGVHGASTLARYMECLAGEINRHNELWTAAGIPVTGASSSVDSIYLGGGTPGMLDGPQLAQVLDAVRELFDVQSDCELTIEASPENVTATAASTWARCGVNRVSLGVQSMVTEELRAVARLHDAGVVANAFTALRAAGIENISVDLIAGLPRQTAASWERSVRSLLDLEPQHFSVYMLEVDDDSRLGSELLRDGERYHASEVPSDEDVAAFYCTSMDLLRGSGFEHYEISNFALPWKRSRHNLKYWTHAPYFGFGTDAHSFDGERRWANADSVGGYIERIESNRQAITELHPISEREKLEERLFLGLRCRDGVSLSRLDAEFIEHSEHTEPITGTYSRQIADFRKAGWLESCGGVLRLTDTGVLFSNEVFAGFLAD